jgi:hypothetical protein
MLTNSNRCASNTLAEPIPGINLCTEVNQKAKGVAQVMGGFSGPAAIPCLTVSETGRWQLGDADEDKVEGFAFFRGWGYCTYDHFFVGL